MSLFAFTALRPGGEKFHGEREAPDKPTLIAALKEEGMVALSVEAAGKRHARASLHIPNIVLFSGVPQNEKILFARNLASMISAGLPLSRAMVILEKQTRNVGMKKTIHGVGESVRQGNALHDALMQYPRVFSPLMIAMVRAGEESGTLSDSLKIVATQLERSSRLTKKVRGAMVYPSIVVTVMLAIGVLMLIYIVPTLAKTFASFHATLPVPTQIVIGASAFMSSHFILVISGVVTVIICLLFARRTAPGKAFIDRAVLMMPIVGGIVAKLNAARTARTLASLLSAGIPTLQALEITKDVVQNSRFRPIIAAARAAVEKGKPVSDAFVAAENIYPVMFAEMAAVGEETGDLPGMLTHVAEFYEEEVEQQTKDLSTIIEPLLMIVIGAGVGFFAVAMIMPIYSLSSSI